MGFCLVQGYKVSDASKGDGIEHKKEDFKIDVDVRTVRTSFPQRYLGARKFELFGSSLTGNGEWQSHTTHPHTAIRELSFE